MLLFILFEGPCSHAAMFQGPCSHAAVVRLGRAILLCHAPMLLCLKGHAPMLLCHTDNLNGHEGRMLSLGINQSCARLCSTGCSNNKQSCGCEQGCVYEQGCVRKACIPRLRWLGWLSKGVLSKAVLAVLYSSLAVLQKAVLAVLLFQRLWSQRLWWLCWLSKGCVLKGCVGCVVFQIGCAATGCGSCVAVPKAMFPKAVVAVLAFQRVCSQRLCWLCCIIPSCCIPKGWTERD